MQSELERGQVSGNRADNILVVRNLNFDKLARQRLRMKIQKQISPKHYPSTDQEVHGQGENCKCSKPTEVTTLSATADELSW